MKIFNALLLLTTVGYAAARFELQGDAPDGTLFVHLVPHSYNPKFMKQVDDFFPWQQ